MPFEPPPGVHENDLSLQKLLITAFIEKFSSGTADDSVWKAVEAAIIPVARDSVEATAQLLQFAELTAGILFALTENPQETLAGLHTYSGTVDD